MLKLETFRKFETNFLKNPNLNLMLCLPTAVKHADFSVTVRYRFPTINKILIFGLTILDTQKMSFRGRGGGGGGGFRGGRGGPGGRGGTFSFENINV